MHYFLSLVIFISICTLKTSCTPAKTTSNKANNTTISTLENWLSTPINERKPISEEPFYSQNSTKQDIKEAKKLLFNDITHQRFEQLKKNWDNKLFSYQEFSMPIQIKTFGKAPIDGHSLYISMHGGGGTTSDANDQQWNNQINLYQLKEGIYVAPRAPTNTWNLWHQAHIDALFEQLIQAAVLVARVNPNKIYLTGYSAGGDGTFQLAPRMADYFAAAAMMAGHPNETTPDGLRNLPFAIFMGANDAAYERNARAKDWGIWLDSLQTLDPKGYVHQVQLVPNKGHWMDRADTIAMEWMAQFTRTPLPNKIVWKQDDCHHHNFYWLGVPNQYIQTGKRIVVERKHNTINILENYSPKLSIYLNDEMLNLDQPIIIQYQGNKIFEGLVSRKIKTVYQSITRRLDKDLTFCSELIVDSNSSVIIP